MSNLLGTCFIAICDADRRTALCKVFRNLLADTAGAAGDERDAALMLAGVDHEQARMAEVGVMPGLERNTTCRD